MMSHAGDWISINFSSPISPPFCALNDFERTTLYHQAMRRRHGKVHSLDRFENPAPGGHGMSKRFLHQYRFERQVQRFEGHFFMGRGVGADADHVGGTTPEHLSKIRKKLKSRILPAQLGSHLWAEISECYQFIIFRAGSGLEAEPSACTASHYAYSQSFHRLNICQYRCRLSAGEKQIVDLSLSPRQAKPFEFLPAN